MSHLMVSKEEVTKTEYDERKVEEVKMLSEVNDPLLDLKNSSLHELISILQKFEVILLLMLTNLVLVPILLIMS